MAGGQLTVATSLSFDRISVPLLEDSRL